MPKKVLFAGCSFVDRCGFADANLDRHWVQKLSNHYLLDSRNIAQGGMSNEEIFVRTMDDIVSNHYDLVIVMWSEMSRCWVYCSDHNIDDATMMHKTLAINGHGRDMPHVHDYTKLHYTYFNNYYIALKKWLIDILALQNTFQNLQQPYVFCKGFDNLLTDFQQIKYTNKGFAGVNDSIKHVLDFDHRPDDYINEKVSVIQRLINQIDQQAWINFQGASFLDSKIDHADDGRHPGPKTNAAFFEDIRRFIDQRELL